MSRIAPEFEKQYLSYWKLSLKFNMRSLHAHVLCPCFKEWKEKVVFCSSHVQLHTAETSLRPKFYAVYDQSLLRYKFHTNFVKTDFKYTPLLVILDTNLYLSVCCLQSVDNCWSLRLSGMSPSNCFPVSVWPTSLHAMSDYIHTARSLPYALTGRMIRYTCWFRHLDWVKTACWSLNWALEWWRKMI